MQPKVILMDEPTSNIDPVGTKKIEETIRDLKKNYTIILVTHSPAQAKRISDYVAFLYLGKIIEMGPAGGIFNNAKNNMTKQYVMGKLV